MTGWVNFPAGIAMLAAAAVLLIFLLATSEPIVRWLRRFEGRSPMLFIGISAFLGALLFGGAAWLIHIHGWPKASDNSRRVIYEETRSAYDRFVTQKSIRISSYIRGTFLQIKFNALLGQKKVPKLQNNPGLNAELSKTNDQYEHWLQDNAKAEAEFDGAIAAVRTTFPLSQELGQMLDTARKPYRVKIDEPPPLNLEEEKQWLQKTSERLNREFDESIKHPLERLDEYLARELERRQKELSM